MGATPIWAGLFAAVTLACASTSRAPESTLADVWKDYRALPAQRALAVAGDVKRTLWVAGASGGHATRAAAEEGALRECRARRLAQRAQAACRLYAVGDEIVWRGP